MAKTDVAVFIDWENAQLSSDGDGAPSRLEAVLTKIKERFGRIVIARAYAGRQSLTLNGLCEFGLTAVHVPVKRNGADIKLSVDMVEISFIHPEIRTYVIVSGDADYVHAASSLRSRGKIVCMVAHPVVASKRLNLWVDEVLSYEELVPDVKPVSPVPVEAVAPVTKKKSPMQIVIRVTKFLEGHAEERKEASLSSIGLHLRQQMPGFNVKDYGYPQLKKLLSDEKLAYRLAVSKKGGADVVTLKA